MKIITVSGKARHGKDTTANILKKELEEKGERVLITHYADLVKYICKTFFGWNGVKDEYGRHILQYVGTDIVRKRNPNYWVNFIIQMLTMFPDEWDFVIIPDARFPNEIEGMKTMDAQVFDICVVRDNFVSPLTEEQQHHKSETALDNYDFSYVIHNNGSMSELEENIKTWIKETLNYG